MARAARAVPQMPLSELDAMTGTRPESMRRVLNGLSGRGRCDTASAVALNAPLSDDTVAVLASSGVAHPAAVRAAEQEIRPTGATVRGVCGWASRGDATTPTTRSSAARVTASASSWAARVAASASSWDDQAQLAANAQCPRGMLWQLAGGGHATHIAVNTAVPATMLQILANDDEWSVRAAVAANATAPASLLNRLSHDDDHEVLSVVAAHPATPRDALLSLSSHSSESVRALAASNPANPQIVMLAKDPAREVRVRAASNPACDADLLRGLANDPQSVVRAAAAKHPNCPTDAIHALAADPDAAVVSAVASRPHLRTDLLKMLAAGPSPGCETVAARNDCTPELFDLLIDNPSAVHRAAANPACPNAALRQIIEQRHDEHLTRVAAANPSTPEELIESLAGSVDPKTRAAAISNPSCPPDVLHAACDDTTETALAAAASNPACTPQQLRRLATHSNAKVRAGAAGNHNTPTDELGKLAHDTDLAVRAAAGHNTSTPVKALRHLLADSACASVISNPRLPRAALLEAAYGYDPAIANQALASPQCPLEAIVVSLGDGRLSETAQHRISELLSTYPTQR